MNEQQRETVDSWRIDEIADQIRNVLNMSLFADKAIRIRQPPSIGQVGSVEDGAGNEEAIEKVADWCVSQVMGIADCAEPQDGEFFLRSILVGLTQRIAGQHLTWFLNEENVSAEQVRNTARAWSMDVLQFLQYYQNPEQRMAFVLAFAVELNRMIRTIRKDVEDRPEPEPPPAPEAEQDVSSCPESPARQGRSDAFGTCKKCNVALDCEGRCGNCQHMYDLGTDNVW